MQPQIRFLGGYALADSRGRPVRVPTKKCWALLGYLVMSQGKDVPRDEIAALLWPRSSDANARASLRQEIAVLRKVLASAGLPEIDSTKELVRLPLPAPAADALLMAKLIETNTPEALREAVALYRGDFLNGLSVSAHPFEDWQWVERLRLKALAQTAYLQLLAQDADGPDTEQAIDTATSLLAVEPTQEQAHRTLMRLYRRMGRRAEALQQFQRCAAVLQRELDTEPSQETVDLAARIRADLEGPSRNGKNGAPDRRKPLRVGQAMRAPQRDATHTVILMLSSLAGVADLYSRLDPAQLAEAQDRLHRFAAQQITDRGGHLIAGWGDRVMACFGHPVLAASDHDRAIGAAQAIASKEIELPADAILRAGVALARGRVLIRANPSGNGQAELVGVAVRQVCDLVNAAHGGEVVITADLRSRISATFETRNIMLGQSSQVGGSVQGYLLRR